MENKDILLWTIIILNIIALFFQMTVLESPINKVAVGCWKMINDTDRSISIMVDGRNLEEIVDTARHEICHEIQYRITLDSNNLTEEFARTCNPEDYYFKEGSPF